VKITNRQAVKLRRAIFTLELSASKHSGARKKSAKPAFEQQHIGWYCEQVDAKE